MQRTPLYSYLEKVAAGDESYRSRLCQQLADRLIYVPIFERPPGESAVPGQFKVRVVRLPAEGEERVLLFTTEKLYKSWAVAFSEKTSFISLLGGDFCAALQPGTAVIIDPGTPYSVVLRDDAVREVASSIPEEQVTPPEPSMPRSGEDLRGRSEPTRFMQRPKVATSAAPALPAPQREEPEQAPAAAGAGLFAGAFSAGVETKKERSSASSSYEEQFDDEPNPRIQFSPGQRPVIFSPDSDANRVVREKEDPNKKKRRSFLKFLKGS